MHSFRLSDSDSETAENGPFKLLCKGVHCVDLGESFPTHIYLQNLASIRPRTSHLKFDLIFTYLPRPEIYFSYRYHARRGLFSSASTRRSPRCPGSSKHPRGVAPPRRRRFLAQFSHDSQSLYTTFLFFAAVSRTLISFSWQNTFQNLHWDLSSSSA